MTKAGVKHLRCRRCKSSSVQSFQSGLLTCQELLSCFGQKICNGFRDILQIKISTKPAHEKVSLSRNGCFVTIPLSLMQYPRSISFPCHFPAVISSIMSWRAVNDQRTEIKDERSYDLFILIFTSCNRRESKQCPFALGGKKIHPGKNKNCKEPYKGK